MKTLKLKLAITLLSLFAISCSKDDEPNMVPEIRENRLVKEIDNNTTKIFAYNSNNQLIKITVLGNLGSGLTQSITNYIYTDGKITKRTQDYTGSESFSYISNYYYANQKISTIVVQKRVNGINYDFQTLSYNFDTPNVIKETDERLNGDKTLAIIDIANENVSSASYYTNVTFSNPAGVLNNTNLYSNYDNKRNPYLYLKAAYYNFPYSSVNNVGKLQYSNGNINYTYEYNSDGYPIKKTGGTYVTTYEYERL